ncbi:MAG TPA: histidine kinase dimerization/phospho-acceptor domain-containing protein, partial [Anaeromyxobacteraceae bacterium]|nr:histidine kinase dimerization/phospho-acceptor domain-containing protein [Anaeromyxobacteraceae bacterium]
MNAAVGSPPADPARAWGEPSADPDLRRKLVWLTLFRLAIVTVLLGGTAIVSLQLGPEAETAFRPLYRTVLATYLASLGFSLALRAGRFLAALAYAQIAIDVALAGTVVAVTGFSDSVFVFMFALAIVNGAILRHRRGAVVAAVLAVGTYVVLAVGLDPHRPLASARLFAHGVAFVGIAALAAYLAEQLRSTGEQLAARESEIAAITALHESIVQSLGSGVLTLDAAGRITFLNRAGEAMTGLTPEVVAGRSLEDVFPVLERTARGEQDWVNRRGERLRLGYSVFPLRAAGGREIGSALIFQDLTHVREMEEQMQRTERLADLGRLAAGLAHELRNPLASMSGSLELLRSNATLDPEDRRLMDIVLREAERLGHLVTDFLTFARPTPPRRDVVDLAEIAAETLRVFAHDPLSSRVEVRQALEPARAACDPDQLRQVLWNLLSNAAQARDAGLATRVICVNTGRDGGSAFL